MKPLKEIFATIVAIIATQISFGQISGTSHDFSTATWNPSSNMCNPCHTPPTTSGGFSPVWNHMVTASVFTLYSSSTFNGEGSISQPDGTSKLCLSCHDGTVALENYGGVTSGTNFITGVSLLGNDLSDEHPISFTYDAALAAVDGKLYDPEATLSELGGTIQSDMLFNDKVQCTSCHNPHDSKYGYFLRKSNTGSALCLTCHR